MNFAIIVRVCISARTEHAATVMDALAFQRMHVLKLGKLQLDKSRVQSVSGEAGRREGLLDSLCG